MEMTMDKKKVEVNFGGDLSVKNVIRTTVKALRRSAGHEKAIKFQIEALSGKKPFMDVVKSYVTIV